VYVSRDDISTDEKTMYNVVSKLLVDIGDFIGVRGTVFKTQVGEISVHVMD
jgi:lysyl-tRNA synthetase class 2